MSQTYEEWHAFIEAHLEAPVSRDDRGDGAVFFTGGDPGEVIVRLTPTTITVWEYAVTWASADTQALTPRRIGTLRWRRVGERAGTRIVQAMIEAAREARRGKYRVCQQCGETQPPEWMHELDVCLSCAQHHSTAVH